MDVPYYELKGERPRAKVTALHALAALRFGAEGQLLGERTINCIAIISRNSHTANW